MPNNPSEEEEEEERKKEVSSYTFVHRVLLPTSLTKLALASCKRCAVGVVIEKRDSSPRNYRVAAALLS